MSGVFVGGGASERFREERFETVFGGRHGGREEKKNGRVLFGPASDLFWIT